MSLAVAVERDVAWGMVDWEELRGRRGRLLAVLPILRAAVHDADIGREGVGALSLRERVGVRGDRARSDLLAALAAGSPVAAAGAARSLAGLGEGSTPEGDDYLVGVMYAVRAMVPTADADATCAAIARAATPLTTRTSASWLLRAAAGQAIPTWSFFLSSLTTGNPARTRQASERVLALGHTSGRAALSGFIAALDILGGPE